MLNFRPILVVGVLIMTAGLADLNRTVFAFQPLIFTQSTKIFDRHGELLYELYGEMKRTPIALTEIPTLMQQATIAAEDKTFYHHPGFDLSGMVRAMIVNIQSGSYQQGGSTISQQLVRNALLTREKSLERKIKELVLSIKLEHAYTKDQILEMYLNAIPYGSNAYGVEAASQTYFDKSARDLTLLESAYLAALPKAPTYYSPYGTHRQELNDRARMVLKAMKEESYITQEAYDAALSQELAFQTPIAPIQAPHFVMYVIDQLRDAYGEEVLLTQGLEVTTTLDLSLQHQAESIIEEQVTNIQQRYNARNAALVSIDPQTGDIIAMVGSKNYFDASEDGEVNVAIQPRQPGSSFKPYVYATAFQKGMNPATMLMDVVTNFGEYGSGPYIPHNYDGRERGPVSVRKALQGSLNIPAVKALFYAGIQDSIDTAHRMGITTLNDPAHYGPSIVLGGAEVTLLDHTSAFGVFAAGGVRHPARAILSITDRKGDSVDTHASTEGTTVIDPAVAYQITNILSDNEARQYIFHSLSKNLVLSDRPVAAKTGTTQAYRDAWTVGYTPNVVTGVWVGNNDNTPMKYGADGSVVAAPIWHAYMEHATANTPVVAFARPESIVELAVDTVSGKLPTKFTPTTKMEVFAPFNAPTTYDDVHVPMIVNGVQRIATVFHAERPLWEQNVQRWVDAAIQSALLANK